MDFLGYLLGFIALIWATKSFKDFFVHKALEKVDAKTEELKVEEQLFTKQIDREEQRLLQIAEEEQRKSKQEALEFWNKKQ